MALVNMKEMLEKARDNGYAVPQFNINNLEWTREILKCCEEVKSPVILGVSAGAAKHMGGYKVVSAMVKAMLDTLNITIPVALHLDHGTAADCEKCIEAGFSSIMFDGSHLSIEENIEQTKLYVAKAHNAGMTIEAEVGSIGGEEDGVHGKGEVADPVQCKQITDLGIDCLAAGIGNIHGKYPANWQGLDFEALEAIKNNTNHIPLVLHGGSGIPKEMIKKAIALGVAKINVNTELQTSWAEGVKEYVLSGKIDEKKGFDPRNVINSGFGKMKEELLSKIEMFGSASRG